MATKGSTYAQDMPEGAVKHCAHVKMMAEAAKAQRAKKGRGNGKRYAYNGIKDFGPRHQDHKTALKVLGEHV